MQMRLEERFVDKNIEVCGFTSSEKKVADKRASKKSKKKQKRAVLTKLFDACRSSFHGPGTVPSSDSVIKLRSVLDSIKPSDLGLSEDMPYFRAAEPKGILVVTCLPIYECPNFSICIFCLPPASEIPLHSHPGMTVFSRLLFGSMHVKSYDWAVDKSTSSDSGSTSTSYSVNLNPNITSGRLAKVHIDADIDASYDTSILYPSSGGNLHCFRARTACAILDVLGPPYSDDEGRHCQYYCSHPFPLEAERGSYHDGVYELLEEIEQPEDFFFVGAEYLGPQIMDIS